MTSSAIAGGIPLPMPPQQGRGIACIDLKPRSIFRHSRESGNPGQATEPAALDSRFRGNDGNKNCASISTCDTPAPQGGRGQNEKAAGYSFFPRLLDGGGPRWGWAASREARQ